MHTLPPLPYEQNALEPHISAETIEYHYGKHFQAYIDNLNNLTKDTDLANASVEEILTKVDAGAIKNNAGQIYNHSIYFDIMTANPTQISSSLQEAIENRWGSMEEFQTAFFDASMKVFGSGWSWLIRDTHSGELEITTTANGDVSLETGIPLIACDVWEHSYYIDYRNVRLKYLEAFWKVLDWEKISLRFED